MIARVSKSAACTKARLSSRPLPRLRLGTTRSPGVPRFHTARVSLQNPFARPSLTRAARHPGAARWWTCASPPSWCPLANSHGVEVTALSPAGTHRIRSTFVLGADGGRSWVRSLLGIGMTGQSHDDVWLVIDCTGDTRAERYGMHHGDPRRPHVIVPGLGGRCRYEFYLYPGEGEVTAHPPFPLIERLLAPHRRITPDQVERAVAYRFHGLNADEWRRGRAFLLGDGPLMPPLRTGPELREPGRRQLTWKLAACCAMMHLSALGQANRGRRPHA